MMNGKPNPSRDAFASSSDPLRTGAVAALLLLAGALAGCQQPASPPAATVAPEPTSQKTARDTAPAAAPEQAPDPVVAIDSTPGPTTTPAQKALVVKTLNTIPLAFDPGAAAVSDASLDAVKNAATSLAATPDLRVRISLAANGNAKLARDRAEALKVQLIVNGVKASAIATEVREGQASAADTVSFVDASGTRGR